MIQENSYLQYFIGYHKYTYNKQFDSGTMVYLRKRFPEEVMNEYHFKDGASGGGNGPSDSDDENDSGSDDP